MNHRVLFDYGMLGMVATQLWMAIASPNHATIHLGIAAICGGIGYVAALVDSRKDGE